MLKAVRDTVIVKLEYSERIGSIVVPDGAKQCEGNFSGTVISIGPDYKFDLKEGDSVYFCRHEGFWIRTEEGKFLSLREKWVVGKYEKRYKKKAI